MNTRIRPGQKTAAHGDDWLITYTDTITLLLCLFVTLLSISVAKHNDGHRSAVHVDPVPGSVLLLPDTDQDEPTAAQAPAEDAGSPGQKPSARLASTAPQAAASPALPLLAPHFAGSTRSGLLSHDGDAAAAQPGSTASKPTVAKAHLPSTASAPTEPEGPRIYTAQISSAAFFGPGSATLSASGADLLRNVAATVRSPRLADYKITVEGHTDDTPIRSVQFPSNWELSTARAAAVVRFLLDAGVPASRLRAAGYADTFPLVPNCDAAGTPIPANQARNRRVVIRLEKVE